MIRHKLDKVNDVLDTLLRGVGVAIGALIVLILMAFLGTFARAEGIDGDPSQLVPQNASYQRAHSESALPSTGSCPQYDRQIRREANKYDNSARLYELAHAVMYIESRCRPGAVSSAGARGLMQVMPATARSMGYRGSRRGLNGEATSIRLGVRYLDYCLNLAGGNFRRAGICYNAGPARISRSDRNLPRETQGYIRLVREYTRPARSTQSLNV